MSEESPEALEVKNETQETVQDVIQEVPVDPNAARIAALEETIQRQNEVLSRMAQSIPNPAMATAPVQRSPYENIKDDELVEGIHVKNLSRQTEELQKKIDEMAEATVQAQFNDLNEVVTPKNLAELKSKHPTIFQSLGVGDTRTKLTNAYLHIKNYILNNEIKKQTQTIKRQPIPQARPSITEMDGAHRSPEEYVPFDGELTAEQKEVIRRRLEGQKSLYRRKIANIG